jgi:hypothetical protein
MLQLGVLAMGRYDDVIDAFVPPFSEDLDMEDLALIESLVGTIEEDDEKEEKRKPIKWEIEEMTDEF